ncbi:hypothetical protein DUNSADRAFT_11860 [Dunaliella salina]|uniref:Encoded protein n=1 Tax=Dunaliella salina TaxID=3046 RepID=A0ABQ7FRM4_DUNSA|nr:hypothetical protein DUNSADRAFT_11860 [Dunaliella salina]|eukprot:KAF5825304.1 hypothetical protein DUNSADRAFT_11860 [Dunaliella salina]
MESEEVVMQGEEGILPPPPSPNAEVPSPPSEQQAPPPHISVAQQLAAAQSAGYVLRELEQDPSRQALHHLATAMNPSSASDVLTPRLARVIKSIAKPLRVPEVMPAPLLLSVVSAVMGCAVRVSLHPDSTADLVPSVWTAVVSPPGSGGVCN